MSVQKGKLLVNGKAFESGIIVPDAYKLLKLKSDEIEELNKQEIMRGSTVNCEDSSFVGFVCDAQSFEEVNKAYEWVKFHNHNARHIICACKIPGNTVLNSEGYEDADEHGAGIKLLEYMESANLESRALFVARFYDGQHIGPQRFQCIIDAAKSAVNQKSYNKYRNAFQFSWHKHGRGGGLAGGRPLRTASEVGSQESVVSQQSGHHDPEVSFGPVDLNKEPNHRSWAQEEWNQGEIETTRSILNATRDGSRPRINNLSLNHCK